MDLSELIVPGQFQLFPHCRHHLVRSATIHSLFRFVQTYYPLTDERSVFVRIGMISITVEMFLVRERVQETVRGGAIRILWLYPSIFTDTLEDDLFIIRFKRKRMNICREMSNVIEMSRLQEKTVETISHNLEDRLIEWILNRFDKSRPSFSAERILNTPGRETSHRLKAESFFQSL